MLLYYDGMGHDTKQKGKWILWIPFSPSDEETMKKKNSDITTIKKMIPRM